MKVVIVTLTILLITISLFSQKSSYIKEIRYNEKNVEKNKNITGLSIFTRDSFGNYFLISNDKDPTGWRLNKADLVYLTNKNVTVEIVKEGGEVITLKSDGANPTSFVNLESDISIFYQERDGDPKTSKFKYSDFAYPLVVDENYTDININLVIERLQNIINQTKDDQKNSNEYLNNVKNLSILYFELGDLNSAEKLVRNNINYALNSSNKLITSYFYTTLGNINFIKEIYFDTITFYLKGLDAILEYVNNNIYNFQAYKLLLYTNLKIALFYEKYNEKINASNFFTKSKDIFKKMAILEKDLKEINSIEFWIELKIEDNKDSELVIPNYEIAFQTLLSNKYDTDYQYDYKLLKLYDKTQDKAKIDALIKKYPNNYDYIRKSINYFRYFINERETSIDEKRSIYKSILELANKTYFLDNSNFEIVEIISKCYLELFSLLPLELKYNKENFQYMLLSFQFSEKIYKTLYFDNQVIREHIKKLIKISEYYIYNKDFENLLKQYLNIVDFTQNILDTKNSSPEIRNIYLKYLALVIQSFEIKGDYDKTFYYSDILLKYTKDRYADTNLDSDLQKLVIAININGSLLLKLGRYNDADKILNDALNLSKDTKPLLSALSNLNIGDLFFLKREFTKALKSYNITLDILDKDNDRKISNMNLLATTYERLANTYLKLNDFAKSGEFYTKNYGIIRGLYENDKDSPISNTFMQTTFSNLASLSLLKEDYTQSDNYYNQSIEILNFLKQKLNNSQNLDLQLGSTYTDLGITKLLEGSLTTDTLSFFKIGIDYFNSVKNSDKNINNILKLLSILKKNGDMYYQKNIYDDAISYYLKYFDLSKILNASNNNLTKSNTDELNYISICYNLAQIYITKKENQKAISYYNEILSLCKYYIDKNSETIDFYKLYGMTLNSLGNLSYNNKDYLKASKYFEDSQNFFKDLIKEYPDNSEFVYMYGASFYNMGVVIKSFSNNALGNKKLEECKSALAKYPISNNSDINNLISKIDNALNQ